MVVAGCGKRILAVVSILLAGVAMTGCSSQDLTQPYENVDELPSFQDSDALIVARAGSRVRIVAFGDETVTGDHAVTTDGMLDLGPYGRLPVAGLTAAQIEEAIAARLAERGHPGVRVSVLLEDATG